MPNMTDTKRDHRQPLEESLEWTLAFDRDDQKALARHEDYSWDGLPRGLYALQRTATQSGFVELLGCELGVDLLSKF
jgi:hypothetical protein